MALLLAPALSATPAAAQDRPGGLPSTPAAASVSFADVKAALDTQDLPRLRQMADAGVFEQDSIDGIAMQDIMMLAVMTDRDEIFEIVLNPSNLALTQTTRNYTGTFYHYVSRGLATAAHHYSAFLQFGRYGYHGSYGFFSSLSTRIEAAGAPLDALDSNGLTPKQVEKQQDERMWAQTEREKAAVARSKAEIAAANRELSERLARQAAASRIEAERKRRRDEQMMGGLFAQRDAMQRKAELEARQNEEFEQGYRQKLRESMAQQAQQPAQEQTSAGTPTTDALSASGVTRKAAPVGRKSAPPAPPKQIVWKGDELLACRKTGERLQIGNSNEDLGDAIKAFGAGCELAHKMKFSTAGSNSLYCDKSGEFSEDLALKLGEMGLGGYRAYGQRAWDAWKANVGCF